MLIPSFLTKNTRSLVYFIIRVRIKFHLISVEILAQVIQSDERVIKGK